MNATSWKKVNKYRISKTQFIAFFLYYKSLKNTYNVANIQPNKGVSWTFEIPAHFSVMKDGFEDDEKKLENKASTEIDDKQSQ